MSSRGAVITRTFARRWGGALVASRLGLAPAERRRQVFAAATRAALEDLGPAFVKLGQLVSVRPDVFSAELVFELSRLRDAAPPVAFDVVAATIEREFGRSPDDLFADFEEQPLASASVAQVHRAHLREEVRPAWGATLPAGTPVAVKVVRPGVREAIETDLAWARRLAGSFRWLPGVRRLDVAGIFDELVSTVARETDMRHEGRTADRFAFDFRRDELVQVPRIAWPLTSRSVLTMEYLAGWRVSELDEVGRAGIDGEALARHGAVAFMRQVLVHGRFHADLHPANLFVTPDGRIAYLDFGIVGHLDEAARSRVASILAAIVDRDAGGALAQAAALGLAVPERRRARLVADLDSLMERTLARERDVRHFGVGLLGLLARHRVSVPIGFGLLVKALVTVEGVARALYPDIDIIETARPFAAGLAAPGRLYSSVRAALRLPVR